MTGASIEATLEPGASSLCDVKRRRRGPTLPEPLAFQTNAVGSASRKAIAFAFPPEGGEES